MNEYAVRVAAQLRQRYAHEPEYLQSVQTWLEMIDPALDDPRYEKLDLLTRMVEPDRMFMFLVPWVDDKGVAHTNHGYRVQFNSAIGPYKGGLRFHPGVTPSVVKFLGFEQTYKNALTGLPIGGAAGGADFDPRGKSNREIMRFCQSFMNALYRYIGSDTDVPAGDIGVGAREIGYLYGQYKRLLSKAESSALTGKGLTYGGSKIRQEAAGFGTVYFLARMLEHQKDTIEGKTIAVSGFGNMSWGVCRKAAELAPRWSPSPAPTATSMIPPVLPPRRNLTSCWRCAPMDRTGSPSLLTASASPSSRARSPGRWLWILSSPAPPRTSWMLRMRCAFWPTMCATM